MTQEELNRTFRNYANYYNLLYKDKDYQAEVDYIQTLISRYSLKKVKSILDLGCGTGNHAYFLSQKGYAVDGVDCSEEMIAIAKKSANTQLNFSIGNITSINLKKKYDVIVSLFHVIDYLTKNEELENLFRTISRHLNKEGIFIVDCWYGPAVLTDRPVTRIKRYEDEIIKVTRIAESVMHPNENAVEVSYEIMVSNHSTGNVEEFHETHMMRYFFKPEIELFLKKCGLKLVHCEEWMTGKPIGFDTWGVCWIGSQSELHH